MGTGAAEKMVLKEMSGKEVLSPRNHHYHKSNININ